MMTMTSEQVHEITKSLAYDMTPAEIAEIEGVDVSAVEKIAADCADEIAEKREFYSGR